MIDENGDARGQPEGYRYDSSPESIWALPTDDMRRAAVTERFRLHAKRYSEMVEAGKWGDHQNHALRAVGVIAGLYPDQDDPSHRLLVDLFDLVLAAANGREDAVLQKGRSRNLRSNEGLGSARKIFRNAFTTAAYHILTSRGWSGRAARAEIAGIWASTGLKSTRKADHNHVIEISPDGLKHWIQSPPSETAKNMRQAIEGDIVTNRLSTSSELIGILKEHAAALPL